MAIRQNIHGVDLFCGVGGLTHGLRRAGVDVRVGVDNDPVCKYPYARNNAAKFFLKPIEELKAEELRPYYRKNGIKLLAGCAPCQSFSTYNQKANGLDVRWQHLLHFSRLVRELNPDLVTMENVPRLIKQDVFKEFVNSLESNGYHLNNYRSIVNCVEYGIPQQRNRLVLLASRLGPIELLPPTKFSRERSCVRDAIGQLPCLTAGEVDTKDSLHRCSSLSDINLRRIRFSKPGGTWHDWPNDLIAECHKKVTGKTYASVYGRMTWHDPAPTITTQFFGFGNGRFGHPEQDRAISLREGAILQGFPKHYEFTRPDESIHLKTIGRLIGNAVPVVLGEVIGSTFLSHASMSAGKLG